MRLLNSASVKVAYLIHHRCSAFLYMHCLINIRKDAQLPSHEASQKSQKQAKIDRSKANCPRCVGQCWVNSSYHSHSIWSTQSAGAGHTSLDGCRAVIQRPVGCSHRRWCHLLPRGLPCRAGHDPAAKEWPLPGRRGGPLLPIAWGAQILQRLGEISAGTILVLQLCQHLH